MNIDIFDHTEVEKFYLSKDTFKTVKGQVRNWKKIFTIHTINIRLDSK